MLVRNWIPAGIIFLIVAVFYQFNTFYMIENNLTDRLTAEPRDADHRVKILAIDEASLDQIGKWPWPRDVLATVVEKLMEGGANSVWIDVLYTEQSQNPREDEVWAKLVDKYEQVYLPAYFQLKARQTPGTSLAYEKLNWPVIPVDNEQVGHINVMEDRDRVVRKALLGVRNEEGEMIPAISVKLANRLLPEDGHIRWDDNDEWYLGGNPIVTNHRGEVSFSYASAPQDSRFEIFSVYQVLNGEIDPTYFEDAVVLIGPYTVGLQDMYYTPMSKTLRMFGVEIHANIIQSFLDNQIYSSVTKPAGLGIMAFLFLLSYIIMDRLKPRWALIVLLGFIIAYTIAVVVAYQTSQKLIPYFYPLMAMVMGYIASVVSQYLLERRERNRVTGIFGRYVAKGVVDEILSSKEEIKVGGVRKEVTLMFVDIRGFTPLSEKIQPEEVVNILNEYLDLCTQSIFTYEGTLDKFMGDGVMTIFGAPREQPDHAERAVHTALLLKQRGEELARLLLEKHGRTVGFGIGINSGPAVIGNFGSKDRLDYTAIGDTVNLAARLESNAKPGQILISENTYLKIQGKFETNTLDPIKVKGKEQPVTVFEVISALPSNSRLKEETKLEGAS
jgi:adenylate cyclase